MWCCGPTGWPRLLAKGEIVPELRPSRTALDVEAFCPRHKRWLASSKLFTTECTFAPTPFSVGLPIRCSTLSQADERSPLLRTTLLIRELTCRSLSHAIRRLKGPSRPLLWLKDTGNPPRSMRFPRAHRVLHQFRGLHATPWQEKPTSRELRAAHSGRGPTSSWQIHSYTVHQFSIYAYHLIYLLFIRTSGSSTRSSILAHCMCASTHAVERFGSVPYSFPCHGGESLRVPVHGGLWGFVGAGNHVVLMIQTRRVDVRWVRWVTTLCSDVLV